MLRRPPRSPRTAPLFPYTPLFRSFCAVDLSAFYFDVRKDVLYCDRPDSLRRRACRSVLDRLFSCLTAWLAPILCFTTEEAWWARGSGQEASVHLRTFPAVPVGWLDESLAAKWAKVREVRRAVTGAPELEHAATQHGSAPWRDKGVEY